ncbi:MAG: DUF5694 domain-containing protein [Saprospiraceae bacterium]
MKNFVAFILLAALPLFLHSQGNFPDPDEILIGDNQLPKVLLVGSFHFAYYNLDAHKVAKEDQVDILSEKRQKEVEELVEYIAKFKPTKIAVETGRNTGYLMREFEEWQEGSSPLKRSESRQIGFRLMERFKLDTIYGVDAGSVSNDLYYSKDSLAIRPYLDEIFEDYDYKSNDKISKRYKKFRELDDKLTLENTLLDYFKFMNSDKVLDRGFGAYLNGDFKNGDYEGADALVLYWYNRNLRILRNIQKITTSPDDRILVIFGAGHVEILKHLFQCTPQYELIKFNEL